MNGILVVNKPVGITSHDVVNEVRRAYNTKKVGHVGTLDPIAEGVLVVCVNQATKLAPFLESDDKIYVCKVLVGQSTDTYDITGNITQKLDSFTITEELIDNTLTKFKGKLSQLPPIYSAIKVNGKKLYQYARSKQEVIIEPRNVEVYEIYRKNQIEIIDGQVYFSFYSHVSKGTYIRSIVNDIGKELQIPCCMAELKRVRSGLFDISQSYSLDEVKLGKSRLVKMLDCLDFEKIDITNNSEIFNKIKNGMKLSLSTFDEKYDKIAFIYQTELLAIYEFNDEQFPCYKATRVWL